MSYGGSAYAGASYGGVSQIILPAGAGAILDIGQGRPVDAVSLLSISSVTQTLWALAGADVSITGGADGIFNMDAISGAVLTITPAGPGIPVFIPKGFRLMAGTIRTMEPWAARRMLGGTTRTMESGAAQRLLAEGLRTMERA